jgi:hypothetical protein
MTAGRSGISRRGVRGVASAVALLAVLVVPARAQTAGRNEAAIGGFWLGAMSLGRSSADLDRSGGGSLPIFRSDVRMGPGAGVEVHAGRALTGRLSVEGTGTWTLMEIRTRVSGDLEDAPAATLTTDVSRLAVEVSALWTVRGHARRSIFVRAGGGWMRELAGGLTLAEDGAIGNIGGGVKYWWRNPAQGRGRRMGVRVDGRAVLRSRGANLGSGTVRMAPAASASLIVGF